MPVNDEKVIRVALVVNVCNQGYNGQYFFSRCLLGFCQAGPIHLKYHPFLFEEKSLYQDKPDHFDF